MRTIKVIIDGFPPKTETIEVPNNINDLEITKIVNSKFGDEWFEWE
tara:strand:+ start:128 stop:265 length:138 start_codon:yes stop_codon:yes gene_type:complete